jgi:F420-dependent oxidoreductase-like protein
MRIGLGTSGPQVVEGWHGQPFERPVSRTREYIEILRKITDRKEPVSYEGEEYQLPYKGDRGLGLGKPLKLIIHPYRPRIPIYIGALGPKNIELTAELTDGWLPIFFAPRIWEDVFGESLANGFAKSEEKKAPGEGFDIAPVVSVVLGDDVDECRREVKQRIALYIGGMGHAKKNFSNQLIRRFGYDKEADEIQRLFLSGEREAAVDAVPDELIDDVALCGPADRIDSLLDRWRESPVTTIICDTDKPETIQVMAKLLGTAAKVEAAS